MFKVPCPKDRDHTFTQVSNSFINDRRLSLKSKALFIFLSSRPPTWCFNYYDILISCTDGPSSVRSSIKQLISFGYMALHKIRNPNKTFRYFHYTIYETPVKTTSEPLVDFPLVAKPLVAEPLVAKPLADVPHVVNNKIKIKIGKTTTTLPTGVVSTKNVIVSPDYIKKKEECIKHCNNLGILCPGSLIKKYGLGRLFKNIVNFKRYISTSDNPTGALVSSIKDNWVYKIPKEDKPEPHAIEQKCSLCGKYFAYLDYKPTRKICPKCE